jgi:hypothetical protein
LLPFLADNLSLQEGMLDDRPFCLLPSSLSLTKNLWGIKVLKKIASENKKMLDK